MALKDTWKDKIQGQDYVDAEDINSIAKEVISIEEDAEKIDHSKLKHLGFAESGHTGFQKELTKEQLAALEAVPCKESLSNKVTGISQDSTDEQYPSAKAVYAAIDACGDFELIDSATLEENVTTILPVINGRYKELYLRFVIPASGNTSSIKARWRVQTLNDSGSNVNKELYNMGNQFIQDYTEEWYVAIHIKVFGTYCRTELWYENATMAIRAYARGMNSSTYNGYVAPSVPMVRDYIDALKLIFQSPTDTADEDLRYIPAGATYELWGIKK